jgi:hypothetical protein
MKTGDLIRALAADSEVHPMPLCRAWAVALIPGVAIALGLHFAVLGLRPHLLTLLGEPGFCSSFASPSCSSRCPAHWSCVL